MCELLWNKATDVEHDDHVQEVRPAPFGGGDGERLNL